MGKETLSRKKKETKIYALKVSVLKTRTVCVNPHYCRNRLTSLSSTSSYFILFHTKTTINGDGRSLEVATINKAYL